MLANQCLSHPWLDKEIIPAPAKENSDDKVINTKNLRRFVIRRRWQVIENFKHIQKNATLLISLIFKESC